MNFGIELNLEPLRRSTAALHRALERHQDDIGDSEIRDSVIKRFEFTYETCIGTLKRYLKQTSTNIHGRNDSIVTPLQDLIREGHAQGILKNGWPQWHVYRDMRNKTSHTYDENIALKVIGNVPAFLDEAQHFLKNLEDVLSPEIAQKNRPSM